MGENTSQSLLFKVVDSIEEWVKACQYIGSQSLLFKVVDSIL